MAGKKGQFSMGIFTNCIYFYFAKLIDVLMIRSFRIFYQDALLKNSSFLMLTTLAGSALEFFFWTIAARYYLPYDVGLSSAAISAMNLISTISLLGLDMGIIRFLPNENDKNGLINSCFTITAFAAILFSMIFISGLNIWFPTLSILKETTFYILFLFYSVMSSLFLLLFSIFIALRRSEYAFIQNTVVRLVKIFLIIVLINVYGLSIFISWGTAAFITFIICLVLYLSKIVPQYFLILRIKIDLVKKLMNFSFKNYLASVLFLLPANVLPLIIVNSLGAEMNAYFFIVWSISTILFMISGNISTSLFVEGSYDTGSIEAKIKKAAKFIFGLMIPVIIFIFIFGKTILSFFGEAYAQQGSDLLLLLTVSSIPVSVNTLYISVKRIKGDIFQIIYLNLFVSLFTILGSYYLIDQMGLAGVGFAWILSNGITASLISIDYLRLHKLNTRINF